MQPFVDDLGEEYCEYWGRKVLNGKDPWLAETEDEFYRLELEFEVPF